MITMEEKAAVRQAVLVEGKSQRQVAQETGRSRNTIRRMIEDSEKPKYKIGKGRRSPVMAPYKELLERWVAEDELKPKKKRRTSVRMYALLRDEYGYQGAESTLRWHVGQSRRQVRHKVYIPLGYEPGETAQVDFGEADVCIAGKVMTAQLFVMWLGYSGAVFVQAYPAASQEVFFAGHVAAFAFFGGVSQEIWYDNLKNAVEKVLRGRGREEQESFTSFRSHYLFSAEFCNVRSGWEKGGVEGKVGYSRRNWLIGAPSFESWEALNLYLRDCCRQEQARCLRGRKETIGERLKQEQVRLRPLPAQPYRCCKTIAVSANGLSLVTFATNRYSVPVEVAHEPLTLHAYVDRIEISTRSQKVAEHDRCWGRGQDILNPHHYLSLLAKRPRAFPHAQAIRAWQQSWPATFDLYFDALKQRSERMEATRIFIGVLQLGEKYTETGLATGLEEALKHHCYTVAGVSDCLRRLTEGAQPAPSSLANHPHLAAVEVTTPDVQRFNQLLSAHARGTA
jgi:transposase